jgi:hypothetical protein
LRHQFPVILLPAVEFMQSHLAEATERYTDRIFYFCTVSTHFSPGSVENSVENVKKCPHFVPFSLLSPVETSVLSTIYSKWTLQKVYRPCSPLRIFSQMKTKRRSEKISLFISQKFAESAGILLHLAGNIATIGLNSPSLYTSIF